MGLYSIKISKLKYKLRAGPCRPCPASAFALPSIRGVLGPSHTKPVVVGPRPVLNKATQTWPSSCLQTGPDTLMNNDLTLSRVVLKSLIQILMRQHSDKLNPWDGEVVVSGLFYERFAYNLKNKKILKNKSTTAPYNLKATNLRMLKRLGLNFGLIHLT